MEMPLEGKKLGDEVWEKISSSPEEADTQTKWQRIGDAIIEHIKTNAVVMAGIQVSTSGGFGSTTSEGKIQ